MTYRVKKDIIKAFTTLTHQKDIDKITVKDIVEECHISRQTFYYHFQDIYAVFEWASEQVLNDTLQKSLKADNAQEALYIFVEQFFRGRELILKMLHSQKRDFVEKSILSAITRYMEEMVILRATQMSVNINLNQKDTALCFYASGIAGVLIQNLEKNNVDAKELAKQLYSILERQIKT